MTLSRTLAGLALLATLAALLVVVPRAIAQLGEQCFTDGRGDVESAGGDAAAARADVVAFCVTDGDTLDLRVELVEVRDPTTDPNFDDEETFAAFGLQTDDDAEEDYTAVFGIESNGELEGVVVETASDQERCVAAASVDGASYRIDGIERSCFGDAEEVGVNASMFYDSDTADPAAPVYKDFAPDDASYRTAAGGQQPPAPSEGPTVQPTVDPTATPTGSPSEVATDRLSGASRIQTAVAISRAQFPEAADVVYLARADVLADAVAGGSLTGGPTLLVPTCGDVPSEVRAEIDRLEPSRVVALGGEEAICGDLLSAAAAGRDEDRLAGADRLTTAVTISQVQFPDTSAAAYLARADVFSDAVAGGSLTAGPILLVPTCGEVPDAVRAELQRLGADRAVALGGTDAVCDDVLTAAAQASGGRPDRLAGGDRFATAAAIAAESFPDTAAVAYLARADEVADAVAGGSLTAGPILLVPTCGELPAPTAAALERLGPDRVVALGGPEAVCGDILDAAASAAGS